MKKAISVLGALMFGAIFVGYSIITVYAANHENYQPNQTQNVANVSNEAQNVPTTKVTQFPDPPKGFNPLTATDRELQYYGFPPRSNDPGWKESMTHSTNKVEMKLEPIDDIRF